VQTALVEQVNNNSSSSTSKKQTPPSSRTALSPKQQSVGIVPVDYTEGLRLAVAQQNQQQPAANTVAVAAFQDITFRC
jgi:hypothetical protein